MDIDRPHRTTSAPTTTSELFICFTSRLSKSSSMRLSSKSILSPARTTTDKSAQPHSLSTSLSRRLRHNGSLRGGQSPAMFPSKKTRGSSGFADNPEPSSPKVTCIGQVRVKTKKQGKKMKMRACRSKRLSGGEASFRRIDHPLEGGGGGGGGVQPQECGLKLNQRNQRWVHLPLTICEALRAFGNEFSCLFPCKSSCFSGGKRGDNERESSTNSCAVFRWLVSLQDGEGGDGKRRDIELVVGGEEVGVVERGVRSASIMMERESSRRRSIFDDMEFDDLFNSVKNEGEIIENDNGGGDDEEEGVSRVSICIPPKNALLLMRCRSDPVKMASLSHKLWEAPLPQDNEDDVNDNNDIDNGDNDVNGDGGDEEEGEECEMKEEKLEEKIELIEDEREETGEEGEKIEVWIEGEDLPCFVEEEEINLEEEKEENIVDEGEKQGLENIGEIEDQQCENLEENGSSIVVKDEILGNGSSIGSVTIEEKVENNENEQIMSVNLEEHQEQMMEKEVESSVIMDELSSEAFVGKISNNETLEREERSELCTTPSPTTTYSNSSEQSTTESNEGEQEQKDPIQVQEDQDQEQVEVQVQEPRKSMERETTTNTNTNTKPTLPDCLLLMMCEPKVSMEVSQETWVCTTDFLKYLPERPPKKNTNKTGGSDDSTKKKKLPPVQPSTQRLEPAAQAPVQPARSSISFPAGGGSVANLIEQKLVKGGGYEPLVLTRCKSAPMRSAAAKIAPSEMTCSLWGRENGRKLEPHRPATFGVGAAGVGF